MGQSGYTCVRMSFCSLNCVMWVVGCGMLGVGVWLRVALGGYATLLPRYSLLSADSLCIAAGIITFLTAFLGCCGSWFQIKCMLVTYFVLVIFIAIMEFIAVTIAFVYREDLKYTLQAELYVGINEKYNQSSQDSLSSTWDDIQKEFECCGVQSFADWYNTAAWPDKNWVPNSCCMEKYMSKDCGKAGDPSHYFQDGCYPQTQLWFLQRLHILGVVGLVLAFIQLFGLISSVLLFCTLRYQPYSHTYKSYETTA